MVVPLRAGDLALAKRYEAILSSGRGLRLIAITVEQLRAAAWIRAQQGMKTPDALQIAAAMSAGCRVLLTNDAKLRPMPGLRIVQLSAYL